MIVLGANSDVAKAFTEKMFQQKQIKQVYLLSSRPELLESYKSHLEVKYEARVKILAFDLLSNPELDYSPLDFDIVFCASGYLGKPANEGIHDVADSHKIVAINYSALVLQLNKISGHLIEKGSGMIIGLSSVAGERGRQSNFLYGSAKAGFTAYLSGLRNYLIKKSIHVMTVKPGFMDTTMTANIDTPKLLTISPEKAADLIYRGYEKKKNSVYISGIWRYIMLIIRNIPEFIFKKLSM